MVSLILHALMVWSKVRPREWLAFNAFRVIGVFADQGYMKIEVVVQHRDSWYVLYGSKILILPRAVGW